MRNIIIAVLITVASFLLLTNYPQKTVTPMPAAPVPALSGVGVNSMVVWSGMGPDGIENEIRDLKLAEKAGFDSLVIIVCSEFLYKVPKDWPRDCRKHYHTQEYAYKLTERLLKETNMHITFSFKPIIFKKHLSEFQRILENDINAQVKFIEFWKETTRHFIDVPKQRLSFNLLNEPEFEKPLRRDKWLTLAEDTIREIRNIDNERVIILEGVGKSLFANRKDAGKGRLMYNIDDIIKPLPYENIVYGFHYYSPYYFTQQGYTKYSPDVRLEYNDRVKQIIIEDAERLYDWASKNQVPVILSEVGVIGFYEDAVASPRNQYSQNVTYIDGKETTGPASNADRAMYASDVYNEFTRKRGIGIVWWALEKEKSIFIRQGRSHEEWIPPARKFDYELLEALGR
jgi:hypothetical protein